MTESKQKMDSPLRVNVASLLVAQAVLVALLAPCDGGRWQHITMMFLWAFDVLACLVFYGIAKLRGDRSSGISTLATIMFAIFSVAVAAVGTYAMFWLHLY
jgi:hypothetical protein